MVSKNTFKANPKFKVFLSDLNCSVFFFCQEQSLNAKEMSSIWCVCLLEGNAVYKNAFKIG